MGGAVAVGGGAAVGGASVRLLEEEGVGLRLQVGSGRVLPLGKLTDQWLPDTLGG